jgi:hypothetical protein
MVWLGMNLCATQVVNSYLVWGGVAIHYADLFSKVKVIFETNIPKKGIAQPQSQFPHSCVCERFIYSHVRSAYSAKRKIC